MSCACAASAFSSFQSFISHKQKLHRALSLFLPHRRYPFGDLYIAVACAQQSPCWYWGENHLTGSVFALRPPARHSAHAAIALANSVTPLRNKTTPPPKYRIGLGLPSALVQPLLGRGEFDQSLQNAKGENQSCGFNFLFFEIYPWATTCLVGCAVVCVCFFFVAYLEVGLPIGATETAVWDSSDTKKKTFDHQTWFYELQPWI